MRFLQAAMTTVALLGAPAGCSYTQVYRGAFSGTIIDPSGRPISGATVIVCTSAHPKSPNACSYRAEVSTDFEGRFQFWPATKQKSCCFSGPSPPPTHLTACARDSMTGVLMTTSVTVDASGATEPLIKLERFRGRWLQTACDARR
ncbi:MAG TPA: carboxypeptidase-like regulatory domain-containing protein [Polyangia bacterium]|nr:carboxypeptidase-like regulatory domain-containing protein [Polyangia bacterium]